MRPNVTVDIVKNVMLRCQNMMLRWGRFSRGSKSHFRTFRGRTFRPGTLCDTSTYKPIDYQETENLHKKRVVALSSQAIKTSVSLTGERVGMRPN